MKILAYSILFLVGMAEIVMGVLVGRLRIYGYVAPFLRDLRLSPEQVQTFKYYINIYQDQWHLVSWLGVITIFATGLLLWSLNRAKPNQ